jgi:hypothetical protein
MLRREVVTERKMIFAEADTMSFGSLEGRLDSLIEELTSIRDRVGEGASIETAEYPYGGGEYLSIKASRLETEEEASIREDREAKTIRIVRDAELRRLAELKAKYEGTES